MLNRIRIILVNTSHPGNIGSVARAMKTMGLTDLWLVDPIHFPHAKAVEMAANAGDILAQARVVPQLEDALKDCQLIVGTSARERTIPWPMLSPRQFAEKAQHEAQVSQVAVVFGREQSGLTNDELHKCHFHLHIPSNPAYSSLNIAAAVQVVAYELRVASLGEEKLPIWDYPFANAEDVESFYQHLQQVLIDIQFLNPDVPRQLMTRLRRLFNRARLDVMEINILRGMLGAVEKRVRGG